MSDQLENVIKYQKYDELFRIIDFFNKKELLEAVKNNIGNSVIFNDYIEFLQENYNLDYKENNSFDNEKDRYSYWREVLTKYYFSNNYNKDIISSLKSDVNLTTFKTQNIERQELDTKKQKLDTKKQKLDTKKQKLDTKKQKLDTNNQLTILDTLIIAKDYKVKYKELYDKIINDFKDKVEDIEGINILFIQPLFSIEYESDTGNPKWENILIIPLSLKKFLYENYLDVYNNMKIGYLERSVIYTMKHCENLYGEKDTCFDNENVTDIIKEYEGTIQKINDINNNIDDDAIKNMLIKSTKGKNKIVSSAYRAGIRHALYKRNNQLKLNDINQEINNINQQINEINQQINEILDNKIPDLNENKDYKDKLDNLYEKINKINEEINDILDNKIPDLNENKDYKDKLDALNTFDVLDVLDTKININKLEVYLDLYRLLPDLLIEKIIIEENNNEPLVYLEFYVDIPRKQISKETLKFLGLYDEIKLKKYNKEELPSILQDKIEEKIKNIYRDILLIENISNETLNLLGLDYNKINKLQEYKNEYRQKEDKINELQESVEEKQNNKRNVLEFSVLYKYQYAYNYLCKLEYIKSGTIFNLGHIISALEIGQEEATRQGFADQKKGLSNIYAELEIANQIHLERSIWDFMTTLSESILQTNVVGCYKDDKINECKFNPEKSNIYDFKDNIITSEDESNMIKQKMRLKQILQNKINQMLKRTQIEPSPSRVTEKKRKADADDENEESEIQPRQTRKRTRPRT